MIELYVNKNLFFLIEKGEILVWDYKNHAQYILENAYFDEIVFVSKNKTGNNEKIYNELLSTNILTKEEYCVNSITWGWDDLSKIFHVGIKNFEHSNVKNRLPEFFMQNYLNECKRLNHIPEFFSEKNGIKIKLPKPNLLQLQNVSFYDSIKNRKTCRKFYPKPISLTDLSTILFSTFGLMHGEEWLDFSSKGLMQTAIRKSTPSSGGLHIEEAYIVIYRVHDIDQGLYHYNVKTHTLTLIRTDDFEEHVINMNVQQFYSYGLSFGVYITARFEKLWWKYKHSRAYSAALLDIGHVSQTFQLSATALGLNTWLTGHFFDNQVEEFLEIDGLNESAILFVGAGFGKGETFPNEMLAINNSFIDS